MNALGRLLDLDLKDDDLVVLEPSIKYTGKDKGKVRDFHINVYKKEDISKLFDEYRSVENE